MKIKIFFLFYFSLSLSGITLNLNKYKLEIDQFGCFSLFDIKNNKSFLYNLSIPHSSCFFININNRQYLPYDKEIFIKRKPEKKNNDISGTYYIKSLKIVQKFEYKIKNNNLILKLNYTINNTAKKDKKIDFGIKFDIIDDVICYLSKEKTVNNHKKISYNKTTKQYFMGFSDNQTQFIVYPAVLKSSCLIYDDYNKSKKIQDKIMIVTWTNIMIKKKKSIDLSAIVLMTTNFITNNIQSQIINITNYNKIISTNFKTNIITKVVTKTNILTEFIKGSRYVFMKYKNISSMNDINYLSSTIPQGIVPYIASIKGVEINESKYLFKNMKQIKNCDFIITGNYMEENNMIIINTMVIDAKTKNILFTHKIITMMGRKLLYSFNKIGNNLKEFIKKTIRGYRY